MGPGGKGEKPAPGDCAPPKTAGSWEIGTLNKDIQKDVYIDMFSAACKMKITKFYFLSEST